MSFQINPLLRPRVFLDPPYLESQLSIINREGPGSPIYRSITSAAENALAKRTTSVLDKTTVAASGNKQDFFAIGAYSWPNPNTTDGMPYIRRDSMPNPEAYASEKFDKGRFQSMVNDVKDLALAYALVREERYALKAIDLLDKWFINTECRMNPNLNHAGAQPGVNEGRYSGVIEGVILIELLDYVTLLEPSPAWTAAIDQDLRAWFAEFSTWLVKSRFGKQEINSVNNHGSYYLVQVMAFSIYGGNLERARSVLPLARRQLAQQIARDGSMPRETERPNSFFYSIYGLRAFTMLARFSEALGEDLWNLCVNGYETPAIARAFQNLAPYLTGEREWTGARTDTGFSPYALQMCWMASDAYPGGTLTSMIEFLSHQKPMAESAHAWAGRRKYSAPCQPDLIAASLMTADLKKVHDNGLQHLQLKLKRGLSKLGISLGPRLR